MKKPTQITKPKTKPKLEPRQLTLIPKVQKVFGGSLIKGHPKGPRPLSAKHPLHLVLKANRGFGARSMLHPGHVKKVNACVRKQAKAAGIRVYHFVNVGNHLHLVVKIQDRKRYAVFIRAITGLIARQVLRSERGCAKESKALTRELDDQFPLNSREESQQTSRPMGYWIKRPFTRVASWGKDYAGLGQYMVKNQIQVSRWGIEVGEQIGSKVLGFDTNYPIGWVRPWS